ncbi:MULTISPECIES: carbohydrate ABC transporter permease [unclassified Embleya]|uniref:carbohydrate ABC transporter permease n=1 Tax=unclassified Embleya TaxID=2699296 RepID=UPI003698B7C1
MSTTTAAGRKPGAGAAKQPSGASGGGNGSGRKKSVLGGSKYSQKQLWFGALAWVIAIVFVAPYIEMAITALRPKDELTSDGYLPTKFEWANFVDVWDKSTLGDNLKISLLVAGMSTLLVLVVSLPAAYYTARKRFRGRGVFLGLVLVTQMFQPTSLLVGLYREFYILDLLDSYWALVLVNGAFNLAFSVWILTAYFSAIPVELEEAAMIDGASRLGALRRVTLPLAMPGIVTAVIFTFIAAWNEFTVALVLVTTPEKQPLTVGINSFLGAYRVEWQYLFAGSVVAIVPVVILFAYIEKHVVSGLTAGSVK